MASRKQKIVPEDEAPSRTQRKREAHETRALARRLINLKPAIVAGLPLDDSVADAIEEARKIRSHVARKRQMQFVAKLLRRDDEQPIRDALEELDLAALQLTARQHRSEAWRDHLLENGDNALGQLLSSRRDVDAQSVRQVLRNAQRELKADKPPSAARSLFRMLRELDEIEPLPPI